MKKSIFFILLIIGIGPSISQIVLKEKGTPADVFLTNGSYKNIELLALQNDSLIFLNDTLLIVSIERVVGVKLILPAWKGWILPVFLLEGVPTVILLVLPSGDSSPEAIKFGLLGLGTVVINSILYSQSGPRKNFPLPWNPKDILQLRSHMRYPQGLTFSQIQMLKEYYLKVNKFLPH